MSQKDGIYQDLTKLQQKSYQFISFFLTDFGSEDYKILFLCNSVQQTNGKITSIDYFGNKVFNISTDQFVQQLPVTLKITIYNK